MQKLQLANKIDDVGYGMMEHKTSITTIKVKIKKQVAGSEYFVDQRLNEEDFQKIFASVLNAENLDLVNLSLDNGINSEYEGYGMMEHLVQKPFFKGIKVNFKESKQVEKILK